MKFLRYYENEQKKCTIINNIGDFKSFHEINVLEVIDFNIGSIQKYYDEINLMLSAVNVDFHLIILTETFMLYLDIRLYTIKGN